MAKIIIPILTLIYLMYFLFHLYTHGIDIRHIQDDTYQVMYYGQTKMSKALFLRPKISGFVTIQDQSEENIIWHVIIYSYSPLKLLEDITRHKEKQNDIQKD
jgi:hypothetical protein